MPPPETATAEAQPAPLTIRKPPSEALRQLERVVIEGNLKMLTEGERVAYYARVCESLGLNPLTRPFEYIELQGKLTLYARKDAGDQLRDIHGVSIEKIERERDAELGLAIVTAYARDRYGRVDSSIGSVSIKGLSGEAMANALMKAETKAKRRVTLSICGLGWMDEIEALDQRAVEVAPRQALTSRIASRTAALTGAATDTEESEAGSVHAPSGAEAAAASSQGVTAAGSPACPHPAKKQKTTDAGVVCDQCGTLLAAREEAPAAPKPRARTRKPKAPDEDGYQRAKAHGLADERGLDPDALKRVAGDALGFSGEWSRTSMTEEQWEYVAGVVESAPVRLEDPDAWAEAASVFAGTAAASVGVGKGDDDPWPAIDASAAEMFSDDVEKLDPADWVEYGLRIGAKERPKPVEEVNAEAVPA